jgi:hypothetical protein
MQVAVSVILSFAQRLFKSSLSNVAHARQSFGGVVSNREVLLLFRVIKVRFSLIDQMKRDVRRSSHLQVDYLLYIAITPNTVIAFLGDTYGTSSRERGRHT